MNLHESGRFLLVDDHPFIIDAYQNAIHSYCQNTPSIHIAQDCKSGYDYIMGQASGADVALLDISMPHYLEQNIKSGIDLAQLIRQQWSNTKVIILSMHSEIMDIEHIIDSIQPEGMIIKNDLAFADLVYLLERIQQNDHFYSDTIVRMMTHQAYRYKAINRCDLELLQLYLENTSTVAAGQQLGISLAIVQKRTKTLAYILDVADENNTLLLAQTAQQKGII